MGTFGRFVVPPHQPSDCLAIYRDARQQLPFRFPLQIEVQSRAMGRGRGTMEALASKHWWDDGSIGPHLEMMTGGGQPAGQQAALTTIEQALARYNRI